MAGVLLRARLQGPPLLPVGVGRHRIVLPPGADAPPPRTPRQDHFFLRVRARGTRRHPVHDRHRRRGQMAGRRMLPAGQGTGRPGPTRGRHGTATPPLPSPPWRCSPSPPPVRPPRRRPSSPTSSPPHRPPVPTVHNGRTARTVARHRAPAHPRPPATTSRSRSGPGNRARSSTPAQPRRQHPHHNQEAVLSSLARLEATSPSTCPLAPLPHQTPQKPDTNTDIGSSM